MSNILKDNIGVPPSGARGLITRRNKKENTRARWSNGNHAATL